MKRGVLLLLAPGLLQLMALLPCAHAASPADPTGVTHKLFTVAQKNFGFSPESVHAEKPYLTPSLYASMVKKANVLTPKGDAPDIEGDLFFNSQESSMSFELGKAAIDGDKAKVGVTVALPGETRHYTVLLQKIDGAWKIADVDYGKDGKLTDQLK
jgi:hypothetical protein